MNLEQLKIFASVVEHGGFRAAAKQLHRSQPAISNAVKSLEQQLGFALFDRSMYRPCLSSKGAAFYGRAKSFLEQKHSLTHFANTLKQGIEAKFTLAIDVILPIEQYADLFKTVEVEYPQTEFQLCHHPLSCAVEQLLDKKADIALTNYPNPPDIFETIPLQTIPLLAVATPAYIEKNKACLFHANRIRECTQIIISDGSKKLPPQKIGIVNEARHWIVSDFFTKKSLLLSGLGWGRLPYYLTKYETASGALQPIQPSFFAAP